MTDYIKLNKDTELQLFHTLFTGQTNLAGKTTAMRTLIPRAAKLGYTILVFDTKPTVREFSGYHDIPICYRPTTDALVLIGLLEGIFHRRITMYYGTLNRLTEDANDIPDIIANAEKMEAKAKSGFIKDACHTLADLLGRLQKELKGLDLSSKLELREGKINIMALNELSTEAQQLVIKTGFELALKNHNRRTLLIIDEAFRFLPQTYSSACKQAVQDVVTQGAKTQLYVWLATQFIATTEKDAIKAMANKLLGRQDDKTEIDATIDRTRDTHPKLRQNDLMTLKRGEFIFVPIDGPVKKIYIPIDEQHEPKPIEKPKLVELPKKIAPSLAPQIRAMKFKSTEPNPLAPDKSFSAGLKIGANEGLEAAAKKVEEINLEHKQIVIHVSHSENAVPLTTETQEGEVVYVLMEAGVGKELGIKDIVDSAAEHGWALPYDTIRKAVLPRMSNKGLIIGDGHGNYRLPKFVKFDIKTEIPA